MGLFSKKDKNPPAEEPVVQTQTQEEPQTYDPTQGSSSKEIFIERKKRLLKDERFIRADEPTKKKYLEKFHDTYGNQYLNELGIKDPQAIEEFKSKFVEDEFQKQLGVVPKKKEEEPDIPLDLPDVMDKSQIYGDLYSKQDAIRPLRSDVDASKLAEGSQAEKIKEEKIAGVVPQIFKSPAFNYLKSRPEDYMVAKGLGEDKIINNFLKDQGIKKEDRSRVLDMIARTAEREYLDKIKKSIEPGKLNEESLKSAEPFIKDAKPGTFIDPTSGMRKLQPETEEDAEQLALINKFQKEIRNTLIDGSAASPYAKQKDVLEKEQEKLNGEYKKVEELRTTAEAATKKGGLRWTNNMEEWKYAQLDFIKKQKEVEQKIKDFNDKVDQDKSSTGSVTSNPTDKERLQQIVNDAYLLKKFWDDRYTKLDKGWSDESKWYPGGSIQMHTLQMRPEYEAPLKEAQEQKAKATAYFEAASRMAYNNEGPLDIKKDAKYQAQAFGDAILNRFLEKIDQVDMSKPTQQDILRKMNEIGSKEGIKWTEEESAHMQAGVLEHASALAGSLIPDLPGLIMFGEVTGALKGVPFINRLRNGYKVIRNTATEGKAVNIGKEGLFKDRILNFNDPVPAGWKVLREAKPTAIGKVKGTILASLIDEAVFSGAMGMTPGFMTGMNTAHLFLPNITLKGKVGNLIQPYLDMFYKSAIGATAGMEAGSITSGMAKALFTDSTFKEEMNNLYPNLDEATKRVIAEVGINGIFFGGMGMVTKGGQKAMTAPLGSKYGKFGGNNWTAFFNPKFRNDVFNAAKTADAKGYTDTAKELYNWLEMTKEPITGTELKEQRIAETESISQIPPIGLVRMQAEANRDAIKMLEGLNNDPNFNGNVTLRTRSVKDVELMDVIEIDGNYYEVNSIKTDKKGNPVEFGMRDIETGKKRKSTAEEVSVDRYYKIGSKLEIALRLENHYEKLQILNEVLAERGFYGKEFGKLPEGPRPAIGIPEKGTPGQFGEIPEEGPKKVSKYEEKVKEIEARRLEMEKDKIAPSEKELIVLPYNPFVAPEKILETKGSDFLVKYNRERAKIDGRVQDLTIDNEQLNAEKKSFKGMLNLQQKKRIKEIDDQIARNNLVIDNAKAQFGQLESAFMDEIRPQVMDEVKNVLPDVTDEEMPVILDTIWAMMTDPQPGEEKLTIKDQVAKAVHDLLGEAEQKPEPTEEPKEKEQDVLISKTKEEILANAEKNKDYEILSQIQFAKKSTFEKERLDALLAKRVGEPLTIRQRILITYPGLKERETKQAEEEPMKEIMDEVESRSKANPNTQIGSLTIPYAARLIAELDSKGIEHQGEKTKLIDVINKLKGTEKSKLNPKDVVKQLKDTGITYKGLMEGPDYNLVQYNVPVEGKEEPDTISVREDATIEEIKAKIEETKKKFEKPVATEIKKSATGIIFDASKTITDPDKLDLAITLLEKGLEKGKDLTELIKSTDWWNIGHSAFTELKQLIKDSPNEIIPALREAFSRDVQKPAEPQYPQIDFEKISENGLDYNYEIVDGKPVYNYNEWKITYDDGSTVVIPKKEYDRQERIWNEESGVKPPTEEEIKSTEEDIKQGEERKVYLNNRLVGYVEDYNNTPKSHKLIRSGKLQTIRQLALELGYSVSTPKGKLLITNENGGKIRRIGVKGEYQTVGSIKDPGLKHFIKTLLDAKAYLNGIDAPSMGPVGLEQSINSLLKGNANQQSQYLLDALTDMYEKGVMIFKKNEGPEGVTVKEYLDLINNEKFSAFIQQHGSFGLETLEEAVKFGLIGKDEIELYKKAIEDENRERITAEQEWAAEEQRIAEEQFGGPSVKVPSAESEGGEDQGPEIRRMAVEMLRDRLAQGGDITEIGNISKNLVKSAIARGITKFSEIIADLMPGQSIGTMEAIYGSLKAGYTINYQNADAETKAKMDIVEARGFDRGSLYDLIGKMHKPEGEDRFKDIVGKQFYAKETHTKFKIDRVELWKDPRDQQIESLGGMFATLPDQYEKQYVAIVKAHALEGGTPKYIPVDALRGMIEAGKVQIVEPYVNSDWDAGINEVMDIYLGINDLEKIYDLEEAKKNKPGREWTEALAALKRLAEGKKYQEDILAGRILPEPVKPETPRTVDDVYRIIDEDISKQGALSPFIKNHIPESKVQEISNILNEVDRIHAALGFNRGQISDIYYLRDKLIASPAIATLYRVGAKARDLANGVREGSIEKVNAEIERLDQELKKSYKDLDQVRKYALTWHIKYAFWNREPIGNITALEKIAEKYGINKANYGPKLRDVIREQLELGIVQVARNMAQDMRLTDKDKYDAILNLYEALPTLVIRSGEGKELQQYSTPPPLSFLMGSFVDGNRVKYLLEPHAGNGSLLINTRRLAVRANDLDYDRYRNLIAQGYNAQHANTMGGVTNLFDINEFDAELMNPPFNGEKADFEGYKVRKDQAAVLSILKALKDNGKAAFILGENIQFKKNGQMEDSFLKFFNYLAKHYNIADIINFDGNLYSRMGTKYDFHMVLIAGRKAIPEGAAPLYNDSFKPENDWNQIYQRINNIISKPDAKSILQQNLVPDRTISALVGGGGSIRRGGKNRFRSDVLSSGEGFGLNEPGGSETPSGTPARPIISGTRRTIERPVISGGQFSRIPPPTATTHTEGAGPSTGGSFGRIPPPANREDLPVSNIGKPDEHPLRDINLAERTGDESTRYIPTSKAQSGNYVVPASIANELRDYMRQLYEEIGDFDNYVIEKLKYNNVTELYQYYFAEQIESIAQGIYNTERKNAMIIGHQAGAGKGRIAAGMIRYARENGMTPVFITQKSDLFNDMYRDLFATGSGHYKPFIVNKTAVDGGLVSIYNPDTGDLIHQSDPSLVLKVVGEERPGTFEVPANTDVIMATYSQFNTTPRDDNKRTFLMSLAERKDVMFIMDESHSASGMSNTGEFFMDWIRATTGGMYLSATYAKRPDNMPLYAIKTVLMEANISWEDLIETIQNGGVALQEMITSQLAESGQFSRIGFRMDAETNYLILGDDDPTQRTYNPELGKEIRRKFDQATGILREIIDFQRDHINPILQLMNDEIKARGRQVGERKGTSQAGVKNSPYFSRITNIIDQLLFALKVKEVIPIILEDLKAGRKPVIGFKNTMEAIFKDMEKMGVLERGMEIPMDFSEVFKRGMRTIMSYTETDEKGIPEKKYLDPADLPSAANRAYYDLIDRIRAMSTGIPISPIDALHDAIRRAGYNTLEITGRGTMFELSEDGKTGKYVVNDKPGKIEAIKTFNNNPGYVLFLNSAGSTGLSAHSDPKFKDTSQRVYNELQPDWDINVFVQKLFRVNRAGQLNKPLYNFFTTTIPAEMRFFMMTAKKLESLDANATGSQGHSKNLVQHPNYFNKYGDAVVVEMLREDPSFNELIGDPLGLNEKDANTNNAVYEVLKKVQILPIADQEAFLASLKDRYETELEYLNNAGLNDLAVTSEDLKAEFRSSETVIEGNGGYSAFGDHTVLNVAEVDVLRKPLTKKELDETLAKIPIDPRGTAQVYSMQRFAQIRDGLMERYNAEATKIREDGHARLLEIREKIYREAKGTLEDQRRKDEDESLKIDQHIKFRIDTLNAHYGELENQFRKFFEYFYPGRVVEVPFTESDQLDLIRMNKGVFLDFDVNMSKPNPYAPSNVFLRFATTDSRRVFRIPVSKAAHINSIIANSYHIGSREMQEIRDNWDTIRPSKQREIRYIITGNILQGMGTYKKGRLIQFTKKDGTIDKGILMPENWIKPDSSKLRIPINRAYDIIKALRPSAFVECVTGDIVIKKIWGDPDDLYEIMVPESKARGYKYYSDPALKELVEEGFWERHGDRMLATFGGENLKPLLDLLDSKWKIQMEIDNKNVQQGMNQTDAEEMMSDLQDTATQRSNIKERGGLSNPANFEPIASRRKKLPDRIGPAPIFNEKPKPMWQVVKEFSDAMETTFYNMKRPSTRGNAIGAYFPGIGRLGTKWIWDMRVIAHEAGHFLDDVFGLVGPESYSRRNEFERELKELSVFGSKPPKGASDDQKQQYTLGEGVAEWFRAWVLNPPETEAKYPNFTRWFKERTKVNPEAQKAMDQFSHDIRVWYGASKGDRQQLQVNYGETPEQVELMKTKGWEKYKREIGGQFQFTPFDHFNTAVMNAYHYSEVAYRWLMSLQGVSDVMDPSKLDPNQNYMVVLKQLLGFNLKADDVIKNGFVDFQGNRIIDEVTQKPLSLGLLLEQLPQDTMDRMDEHMQEAFKYGVAQRTIEVPWKMQAWQIELDLSSKGNYLPPLDILSKHPYRVSLHKAKIESILKKIEDGDLLAKDVFLPEERYDFTGMIVTGVAQEFTLNDYGHAQTIAEEFELMKATDPAKHQWISEFLRVYRAIGDVSGEYLRDSGWISSENLEQYKAENLFYIMFSRIPEMEPGDIIYSQQKEGPAIEPFENITPSSTGLLNPRITLKRIEGSRKAIEHPLYAALSRWMKLMQIADQNYLAQTFAMAFKTNREFYSGDQGDTGYQKSASIGWISDTWEPNSISFRVEGRPKYLVIRQDDLYKSVAHSLTSGLSNNILWRAASFFPQIFRKSIITALPFMIRNTIKDTQKFFTIGHARKFWRIWDLLPDKELRDYFITGGGGLFGYIDKSKITFKRAVKEAIFLMSKDPTKIITHPSLAFKTLNDYLGSKMLNSETLIRFHFAFKAAYREAKEKYKLSDSQATAWAVYHSRNLLDHAVKGTYIKQVNQVIPFIAPAIGGMRADWQAIKKNPGSVIGGMLLQETLKILLMVILPLMILRRKVEDESLSDEERMKAKIKLDEYDKMPAYQKDLFFNSPLTHGWLSIPRQYDIGLTGVFIERALYAAMIASPVTAGGDTLSFGQRLGNQFGENPFAGLSYISPISMESPLSTGYKGFIQAATKQDKFRGKYIVPPEEQRKAINFRMTETASPIGQFVQKASDVLTPNEKKHYVIDARIVDNFIESQFTYYGRWSQQLAEALSEGKSRPQYQFKPLDLIGLYKYTPAFNSPDVRWLQNFMAEFSDSKVMTDTKIREAYSAYAKYYISSMADKDEAEMAAYRLREFAGIIRDITSKLNMYEIADQEAFVKKIKMGVFSPEEAMKRLEKMK